MKTLISLLIFFLVTGLSPDKRDNKIVYGFFDDEGNRFVKMIIIGETVTVEKADTLELDVKNDKSLLEYDTRPDTVTVKILNNPRIRVGQTLFLLEKHHDHDFFKDGNIVGEIKVTSIYETTFFGQQLRGEGHLRMIEKIMTVAMPITTEGLYEAKISKKQGDYFVKKGDFASAIQYYKKSIKLDPNAPEPHAALGKLHEANGHEYISAAYEYNLAYKSKDKFADEQEKLEFLINYSSFLIQKHKEEAFKKQKNYNDLELSHEISRETSRILPMNFKNLMNLTESSLLFYYIYKSRDKGASDREIRDKYDRQTESALEKTLSIQPQSYRAQALAVYYYVEKLKEIPFKNLTTAQATEVKDLIQKIDGHINKYNTYRPRNKKPDVAVLQAREYLRSLR